MIEVIDIVKEYEGQLLLNGVSFLVNDAQVISLLGPSGSGKSTLLRIIAGLEKADSGSVLWMGKDYSSVPTHLRNFGLMFQEYALFPHLSVEQNVAFGLSMKQFAKQEIDARVAEVLSLVQMQSFSKRNVSELSGGEQQRVALARTIASKPNLLMLDEPLSALDRTLKEDLLTEIRSILEIIKTPVIYVTHDQQEAFSIADQVLILHEGIIQQKDHPADMYQRPINPWVAGFLGYNNTIEGTVQSANPLVVSTIIGDFSVHCDDTYKNGEQVLLVLKPDGLIEEKQATGLNTISGKVKSCLFREGKYILAIEMEKTKPMTFSHTSPMTKGWPMRGKISSDKILCYKNE